MKNVKNFDPLYHLNEANKRLNNCWNKPVSQWRKLFPKMERELYIASSKSEKGGK